MQGWFGWFQRTPLASLEVAVFCRETTGPPLGCSRLHLKASKEPPSFELWVRPDHALLAAQNQTYTVCNFLDIISHWLPHTPASNQSLKPVSHCSCWMSDVSVDLEELKTLTAPTTCVCIACNRISYILPYTSPIIIFIQ